jgi:hypothetical protein
MLPMMRLRRLGPFALFALATIACTSVLGTFEVADVAGTDGGGTTDGPAPADGATDMGKPADGGADAKDSGGDVKTDAPPEGGASKCRVADGGAGAAPVEVFNASVGLVGCGGAVNWADRALLCGPGCTVVGAEKFVVYNVSNKVPTHHYWTDDDLFYSGSPPSCAANTNNVGSACPGRPMRVCVDGPNGTSTTDPSGNTCTWTGCGLNNTAKNDHFGGCAANPTAGTLCICPP